MSHSFCSALITPRLKSTCKSLLKYTPQSVRVAMKFNWNPHNKLVDSCRISITDFVSQLWKETPGRTSHTRRCRRDITGSFGSSYVSSWLLSSIGLHLPSSHADNNVNDGDSFQRCETNSGKVSLGTRQGGWSEGSRIVNWPLQNVKISASGL